MGVGLHLNSIGCANNSTLANGSVSHDQVREGLHSAAKPTEASPCADGTLFYVPQRFPANIVAADAQAPVTGSEEQSTQWNLSSLTCQLRLQFINKSPGSTRQQPSAEMGRRCFGVKLT